MKFLPLVWRNLWRRKFNTLFTLAASFFSDVKISAVLRDPQGKSMPVPEPDSKLRVEYCAPKAGEYKLILTPSTGDYFSHAGVDCNLWGPVGLKRLKRLGK